MIFVPGNRRDMLEKAGTFEADVIVADLEDSVPPSEKLNARRLVRELAPTLCPQGQKLMVRLNSLDTGLTQGELGEVISPDLYAVSVGKIDSPLDIRELERIISNQERRAGLPTGQIKLVPWVETARAVMSVEEIAIASPRVVALAFGGEDYTNDMGVRRSDTGEELYFARARIGVAARAARAQALDSVYVRYQDSDGLKQDIQTALDLGFKGKFAIHPSQLAAINQMFSPSPDEVEYARKVVDVWEKAEVQGRGSAALDGRMIDVPVVKRARNLLELAEAIASPRKPPG